MSLIEIECLKRWDECPVRAIMHARALHRTVVLRWQKGVIKVNWQKGSIFIISLIGDLSIPRMTWRCKMKLVYTLVLLQSAGKSVNRKFQPFTTKLGSWLVRYLGLAKIRMNQIGSSHHMSQQYWANFFFWHFRQNPYSEIWVHKWVRVAIPYSEIRVHEQVRDGNVYLFMYSNCSEKCISWIFVLLSQWPLPATVHCIQMIFDIHASSTFDII